MRYSIILTGGQSMADAQTACTKVGARDVKVEQRLGMVFCELTAEQAVILISQGFKLKEVKSTGTAQIAAPTEPLDEAIMTALGLNISELFNGFRGSFTPPLTGIGLTVVVADTGIRKTHESLSGKVIYEENFSDAPDCDDLYNHGTAVAYLVAGGTHGSINSGVAPDAKIINLKCLNDKGEGTDEWLIDAINKACDLVEQARTANKPTYDPSYPNVINISVGAADDGDPDDPVRTACRTAVEKYGLQVIAASGNAGDKPSTILNPACEPSVIAIGGLRSDLFAVWEYSSRGPTQEGEVKPDFCFWATSIHAASSEGDDKYTYKTGTSFSTPIASGLIGLIWELGRRTFGPGWTVTWYDISEVGEQVCVKAEGVPLRKDNSWGYGLPAVDLVAQGASRAAPAPVGMEMVTAFLPLMIMFPLVSMFRRA